MFSAFHQLVLFLAGTVTFGFPCVQPLLYVDNRQESLSEIECGGATSHPFGNQNEAVIT